MLLIASDHKGFNLKEKIKKYLDSKGVDYKDLGPEEFTYDDDYPDFAKKVALGVAWGKPKDLGILICDTGIGMDITANKFKNVRAALCTNVFMAKRSREHNNANILVLASETGEDQHAIVEAFLQTKFTGGDRHLRRLEKIQKIEDNLF